MIAKALKYNTAETEENYQVSRGIQKRHLHILSIPSSPGDGQIRARTSKINVMRINATTISLTNSAQIGVAVMRLPFRP
jgi:hypothetical protein